MLILSLILTGFFAPLTLVVPMTSVAENSICARVKIEIRQEVTFERQAFDAHMQITNGLTTLPLEDINVDVLFTDAFGEPVRASSNPDDPDALFFIRVSSMEGIDSISGEGSIPPATAADIHWLIIPAPDSVLDNAIDTLYFVGAQLTYTLGGDEQVTNVNPDSIKVRPLPLLTLDYFLPTEVYGDDPFTAETEPSIPFSLGVRIANNGHGTVNDFKIDSAQPKIVDNELGLAVDFLIEGSEVNGEVRQDTLLINFGEIEPSSSTIGRWLMTSTLSGRFVEFDADYSHANELGGELTSVLEMVDTHFLVRDVLVDLPGRDAIRDFLGKDDDVYRVYESDAGVTEVTDISGGSSLTLVSSDSGEVVYTLTTVPTAGFSYLRLDDPLGGSKLLAEVTRSDGKVISPHNGWLSKKRVDATWTHYLSLFDCNGTSSYTLKFIDPFLAKRMPEFVSKSRIVEKEGKEVSFKVTVVPDVRQKSAPTSTGSNAVQIHAGKLPVGAQFSNLGDKTGIFRWNPRVGQAGDYPLTFTATDGDLTTTTRYHLTITDAANVPVAQFTGSPTAGTVPLDVVFIDASISSDGIKHWFWDFGDNTSSTSENPGHTYEKAGTYSVALTVTEIDGDRHTVTYPEYVTVHKDGHFLPIEFGTLNADHSEQPVQFSKPFVDPVIVATVTGAADAGEPAKVSISRVTPEGFSIRLVEGPHTDATHPLEEVSFIAIERGTYTLENGSRIIADHLESSARFKPVPFSSQLNTTPVVMASLASADIATPAHAVITDVSAQGFEVKRQPKETEEDAPDSERINFIAWEPSVGRFGSTLFEVGTMEGADHTWQWYSYSQAFNSAPVITAGRQSQAEQGHATVQGRRTTAFGIEFRIAEPASLDSETGHPREQLGFIALSALTAGMDSDGDGITDLDEVMLHATHPGRADTDGDGLTDRDEVTVYATHPNLEDTDGDTINDNREIAFWGSNWSGDLDNDGSINLLDFDADNDGAGDGLELHYGFDPADALSRPVEPLIECGTLSVDHNHQLVRFSEPFVDPVIVATITGAAKDTEPAAIRISAVTPQGFTIRLEEGLYADTTHPLEEVSFIAIERGTYLLENGKQIIAGHLESSAESSFKALAFPSPLDTTPVVMATLASANDPTPAQAVLTEVNTGGFRFKLQQEEAMNTNHGPERIDFIAWEPSTGLAGSIRFDVGFMDGATDAWHSYNYNQVFRTTPLVTAIRQSHRESDPAATLGRHGTGSGIEIRLAEDRSLDSETKHVDETIGYIVIGQ